jgi:ribokinase
MPLAGQTVMGNDLHFLPGGKGLNQAIAAAKWEIEPTLIGAVGEDDFGIQLVEYARGNGVDVGQISHYKSLATGTALITVAASGENSIVVISGANAKAAATRPSPDTVALAQMETSLAETEQLFVHIRETGGTTILNPSPFQPIPKSLLAECDVLIANQTELAQMTATIPGGDLEAAEWALRKLNYTGRRCYIVTLGAEGCLCSYEGDVEYFPGHQVNVVDTTGAGDCFAGIFAASVAKGFSYSSAAMVANAGAALSTTRRGAAPAMPTMAEVHNFIAEG